MLLQTNSLNWRQYLRETTLDQLLESANLLAGSFVPKLKIIGPDKVLWKPALVAEGHKDVEIYILLMRVRC